MYFKFASIFKILSVCNATERKGGSKKKLTGTQYHSTKLELCGKALLTGNGKVVAGELSDLT